MDFTINKYKQLLGSLLNAAYAFQTFSEFLERPADKVIILRHDVDAKKLNSLYFAKIQKELGISGSYYFRMVPQSYDTDIIKQIADLGHEIGYHYEDMDFASSKFKVQSSKLTEEDLYDSAYDIFKNNLEILRKIYPVKTICMHGSPRSAFDNKALWKKYNYKDYGIIGEPYFDVDFNDVLYLTDTGRRWDGGSVSIRDKVHSSISKVYHTTNEIIQDAERGKLPNKIMFTFHPQRWTNNLPAWTWEFIFQNLKNKIKKYYVEKS